MKHSFFVILLALVLQQAVAQEGYRINGKLSTNELPVTIFLRYNKTGTFVKDSVISKDGTFQFKGSVKYPVNAVLSAKYPNEAAPSIMNMPDEHAFYLENTNVTVSATGKITAATVNGGKAQSEYLELKRRLQPMEQRMAPLSAQMRKYFQENNEEARKALFPQLAAIRKEMTSTEEAFIKDHPDSYVSLNMVNMRGSVIDPAAFEPLFNQLSNKMKETPVGKELSRRLAIAKKTDVGQSFIDFALNDTEGKTITLGAQKGKYVLLDFWASWCGPCRAENPHVLKAYHRFKEKNFDVVAVSLDDKKDAWLKAIREDGMPWIHLSDLKGFESAVAKEYGIRAIPQNFLLDPEGRIVAKNLRGEALEKKLEEILN